MKKYIVILPIILFFVFWAITLIPDGFILMSDHGESWYTPYTSIIFLILAIFFYPATFIFEIIAGTPQGAGYHATVLIYSIILSFLINKAWNHFESNHEKS